MKKEWILFSLILLIMSSNFAHLVSATSILGADLGSGAQMFVDIVRSIFGPLFEPILGISQFDEYFFMRVLVLILLYVVIWAILKKIPLFKEYNFISFLIAAIISILGMRYIPETKFINLILLPYSTLAVALSIALPFMIYFFFVHFSITSNAGRRIAWLFFAAVFFGLWITRTDTIGDANIIYWFGIAAVILVFIFDKKIHVYFALWEIRGMERTTNDAAILELLEKLGTAKKYIGTPAGDRQIKHIREQLKRLGVANAETR